VKFTQSHHQRLEDGDAEAARQNADKRIAELQTQVIALTGAPGRYLGTTVISSLSTYTPRPGTKRIVLDFIGGGGGGGGATPGAGVGAGAGGSSGVRRRREIVSTNGRDITGGVATPGAAGAKGANTGGAGGDGGASAIKIGGVTYTAEGGKGGPGMVGIATSGNVLPVAPSPAAAATGELVGYSNGTEGEIVGAGAAWWSGSGGGTDLGAGGIMVGGTTAGRPGSGMGGGGGGAAAQASGQLGGLGATGGFVIEEYT